MCIKMQITANKMKKGSGAFFHENSSRCSKQFFCLSIRKNNCVEDGSIVNTHIDAYQLWKHKTCSHHERNTFESEILLDADHFDS